MPSPRAAVVAWVFILVVLNMCVHPVLAGTTWAGLALFAHVTRQHRLIALSLMVGIGMLLVVPGLSIAQGGIRFTLGATADALPTSSLLGIVAAVASSLRVPAQVLAIGLVAAVSSQQLIGALSSLSHRSALLAGLVARLRPLVRRDAERIREELVSLGVVPAQPRSVGDRLRTARSVWDSMVMTLFDRADVTARVLASRGLRPGITPTTGVLHDPRLRDLAVQSRLLDFLMLGGSLLAFGGVVAGRISGSIAAPVITLFPGVHDPVSAPVVMAALAAASATAGSAIVIRRGMRRIPRAVPASATTDFASHESPFGLHDVHEQPGRTLGHDTVVSMREVRIWHPDARGESDLPAVYVPSLEILRGRTLLLVGASGSGKSTLLDAVMHGGGGNRVVRVSGALQVTASRVSVLFQDPDQQVVLDRVAEDVTQALRADGLPSPVIEARALSALSAMGCEHLARRMCGTLSGGELQRVALAGVLARRPEIVVLDEPTAMLDTAGREQLLAALCALRAACGCAVIIAEHGGEDLLTEVDDVVVLAGGTVAWSGAAGEAASVLREFRCSLPRATATIGIHGALSGVQVERFAARNIRVVSPDGRLLVRHLSVSLPAGGVLAIVGPNGAGKSTLLRAIRGLHPFDGMFMCAGQVFNPDPRTVAWVSQSSSLVLGSRVAEHVSAVLRACAATCSVGEVLADVGLAHHRERHPADLSVGERQRLALAAACAGGAVVWLLDEPSRGLDAAGRAWLAARIRQHARAGGVVLVATHDQWLIDTCASHELDLADAVPASRARLARHEGVAMGPPPGGRA